VGSHRCLGGSAQEWLVMLPIASDAPDAPFELPWQPFDQLHVSPGLGAQGAQATEWYFRCQEGGRTLTPFGFQCT
jgi:hypothetical protein